MVSTWFMILSVSVMAAAAAALTIEDCDMPADFNFGTSGLETSTCWELQAAFPPTGGCVRCRTHGVVAPCVRKSPVHPLLGLTLFGCLLLCWVMQGGV